MPTEAAKPEEIAVLAPTDDVDPELLALPDPPKTGRAWAIALLGVTAAVCALMAALLLPDARYALAPKQPTPVGELAHVALDGLEPNQLVHASGALGVAGAIRFERPLSAGSFRLMPVAGRKDLWVEVAMPRGLEGSRYVPKSEFTGRIVPLADSGMKRRGIANAVRATTGTEIPSQAWVLVDGESPSDARWAAALASMFAAFALWNVVTIARLLRRVE